MEEDAILAAAAEIIHEEAILVAAGEAAKRLGYAEGLRDLQQQVVAGLLRGKEVFGILGWLCSPR